MAKRLLRRYGWWVLTVLILATLTSGFLLLPVARAGKVADAIEESAFDTDYYSSLLAGLVADETELVQRYRSDYVKLHALMPPAEDWFLVIEGGVVPYDTSFPKSWFIDELTAMTEMGVPCRSVILWLDPTTRETVVWDELTLKEVATIPADWGFNPLDLIVEAWGERVLHGVDRSWVLSAYSPSRMAFRYTLIWKSRSNYPMAGAVPMTSMCSGPRIS